MKLNMYRSLVLRVEFIFFNFVAASWYPEMTESTWKPAGTTTWAKNNKEESTTRYSASVILLESAQNSI